MNKINALREHQNIFCKSSVRKSSPRHYQSLVNFMSKWLRKAIMARPKP